MPTVDLGPCDCCLSCVSIEEGVADVLTGPSTAYQSAFIVSDSDGFNSSTTVYDTRSPSSVGSNRTRLSWFDCAPQTLTFPAPSTYFENFAITGSNTINSGWFLRHGTGCYLNGEPPPITTSDLSFAYCISGIDPATGQPSFGVRFYARATGSTSYPPISIEKDGIALPATSSGVRLTLDTGIVFQAVSFMSGGTFRFIYAQGVEVIFQIFPIIAEGNPLP